MYINKLEHPSSSLNLMDLNLNKLEFSRLQTWKTRKKQAN